MAGENIRIAEASDAEALTFLINQAFQVEKFFLDADRITVAEVRQRFETGVFLVLEESRMMRACVYLENQGERAYLGLLSVDPASQGQGLGSVLLASAEQYCRSAGCRFVDLRVVNLRKELPPFYRGHGYVESGQEPFPEGVPLKLPCHFVRMSKPL